MQIQICTVREARVESITGGGGVRATQRCPAVLYGCLYKENAVIECPTRVFPESSDFGGSAWDKPLALRALWLMMPQAVCKDAY